MERRMESLSLSDRQKKARKLKKLKSWLYGEMKSAGISQAELGEILGLSQTRISQMLMMESKSKRKIKIEEDPFSYGDLLILFKLFNTDNEEKESLLTL